MLISYNSLLQESLFATRTPITVMYTYILHLHFTLTLCSDKRPHFMVVSQDHFYDSHDLHRQ